MTQYGFADWEGNDRHFMGWAGTGVHFDPIIASNAASWLRANATHARPAVVPDRRAREPARRDVVSRSTSPATATAHPDDVERTRRVLEHAHWKEDDVLPLFSDHYDEVCDELPANFGDDLLDKPDAQRQWRWDQQHGLWGYIDPVRQEVVAAPPRLLREAPADGRRLARHRDGARSRRAARTTTRS